MASQEGRPNRFRRGCHTVFKYLSLSPCYIIGYLVWFLCSLPNLLCFTGKMIRPELCGTGAMQRAQRERAEWRINRNQPRPLYRKKIAVTDGSGDADWVVDEKALMRRRRLSFDGDDNQHHRLRPLFLRRIVKDILPISHEKVEPSIEESALLALPIEIRAMIWRLVVGERDIHITYGTLVKQQPHLFPFKVTLLPIRVQRAEDTDKAVRRLAGQECVYRPSPWGHANLNSYTVLLGWHGWNRRTFGRHRAICQSCGMFWDGFGEIEGWTQWDMPPMSTPHPEEEYPYQKALENLRLTDYQSEWKPLAFLMTCRQIYAEAIPLLYSTNVFHFGPPYQHSIKDFLSTLLPQRIAQLKHIRTPIVLGEYGDYYDNLRNVLIKQLPSLEHLELQIASAGAIRISISEAMVPTLRSFLEDIIASMKKRDGNAQITILSSSDPDDDWQYLSKLVLDAASGMDGVNVYNEDDAERARKQSLIRCQ